MPDGAYGRRARVRSLAAAALRLLALAAATAGLVAGCAGGPAREPGVRPMRVSAMTFNIRYGTAADGPNHWTLRREMVFEVFRRYRPDFVGVQEAVPAQVEELRQALPDYHHVGRTREADPARGEAVPIFYRHERWAMASSGTFWLSDTPEEPGSKTWGNQIPRIATWALFLERSGGRPVYVFNVHLDHQSQPAREKGAALLARRIEGLTCRRPQAGRPPLLVMGDFNAGEDNPAVLALAGRPAGQGEGAPLSLVDTFRVRRPRAKAVGTFGAWTGKTDGDKIDYVFTWPGVRVRRAEIVHDHVGGRYPSDHFPVWAEVEF